MNKKEFLEKIENAPENAKIVFDIHNIVVTPKHIFIFDKEIVIIADGDIKKQRRYIALGNRVMDTYRNEMCFGYPLSMSKKETEKYAYRLETIYRSLFTTQYDRDDK